MTRRGGLAALDVAVALARRGGRRASGTRPSTSCPPPPGPGAEFPTRRRRSVSAYRSPSASSRRWALSRFPAAVRRPFVALAAAALPLAPVLTGRLLPLLVFQGGVLRLLAAAVLAVAVVRLASLRGVRPDARRRAVLFAAAFLFYCAWGSPGPRRGRPAGRRAALSRHGPEPPERRRPGPDRRVRRPGIRALLRRRPRAAHVAEHAARAAVLDALPGAARAAAARLRPGRLSRGARAAVRARRAHRRPALPARAGRDQGRADRRRGVGPRDLHAAAGLLRGDPLSRRRSPRWPIVAFLLTARAAPGAGRAGGGGRSWPSSCPGSTRSSSRSPPRASRSPCCGPTAGAARAAAAAAFVASLGAALLLLPCRCTAARRSAPRSAPRTCRRGGCRGGSRARSSTGSTACSIVAPALALAHPRRRRPLAAAHRRCPPRRGARHPHRAARGGVRRMVGRRRPSGPVRPARAGSDAARRGHGRAPRARCAGRAWRDRPDAC